MIEVILTHYSLKVRFGGVLHLRIPRKELLAIDSWQDDATHFSINYTLRDGCTVCEYDDEAKWRFILSRLDELLP